MYLVTRLRLGIFLQSLRDFRGVVIQVKDILEESHCFNIPRESLKNGSASINAIIERRSGFNKEQPLVYGSMQ